MSYAVEMVSLPVRLVTADGGSLEAEVFLHTVGDTGRRETLGDRLNDRAQRFLPCRIDGRVELVHKERLALVEVLSALPELAELAEVGAERQAVELVMTSGRSLRGELVYSRPRGSQRVSDLLNAEAERFLLLVESGGAKYVHRDELLRVRE